MNREIKFRGWYVKAGKTIMITFGVEGVPKELELKLDYTTVQQFTGLHDKNGKEIYEGDVLKIGSHKAVVCWRDEGWMTASIDETCIEATYKGKSPYQVYLNGDSAVEFDVVCLWRHEKPEVIGNIYENPNLLTQ